MKFTSSLLLAGLALVSASPVERATKPPAFLLAGDSTTATPSGSGGGWGDGFLATLTGGAIGTNYGHNGATTATFVSGGDWATVIAAVKSKKASYTPYVTIQFGHNDQKVLTIAQYTANLKTMANAVIAAGGVPIMTTSLSRRKYKNGVINPDLVEVVAATLSVATELGVAYIDLNKASMKYLNSIGEANGIKYNRISTDYTHLSPAGGVVFGNMVAGLIKASKVGTAVTSYIAPKASITAAISAGTYISGA